MQTSPVSVREAGAEVTVFSSFFPVPGYGVLPINAFLLHAEQPVLVDTGPVLWGAEYFDALRRRIDLSTLRWIFLTHGDPDHVGCLRRLLDAAPQARLVTTFIGLGKLALSAPVPLERVYLLNPGQELDVGDRQLLALRPPSFDAPETCALYDRRERMLFSSDCFGALLAEPVEAAEEIDASALRDGQRLWATVDAPWLASVRPDAYEDAVNALRGLGPELVLSSHLPPASGIVDALFSNLWEARTAPTFVGPDQAALLAQAGRAEP